MNLSGFMSLPAFTSICPPSRRDYFNLESTAAYTVKGLLPQWRAEPGGGHVTGSNLVCWTSEELSDHLTHRTQRSPGPYYHGANPQQRCQLLLFSGLSSALPCHSPA